MIMIMFERIYPVNPSSKACKVVQKERAFDRN